MAKRVMSGIGVAMSSDEVTSGKSLASGKSLTAGKALVTAWAETVPSTTAKNEFARVLELAVHRGPVRITKNRKPRAVLVSIESYEELLQLRRRLLDDLSGDFDGLLARMQQPDAVAAADDLFDASPDELGQAAIAGARGPRGSD